MKSFIPLGEVIISDRKQLDTLILELQDIQRVSTEEGYDNVQVGVDNSGSVVTLKIFSIKGV